MGIQVLPTQGSISGRIGAAFGRGLSESLPKEVERYRLSQGLKNIGQKQDLTPYQQFAELSSVPGVTPQMIQSGAELLKQQGIRGAYQNRGGKKFNPNEQRASPKLDQIDFANLQSARNQQQAQQQQPNENVQPNEFGQPQIVEQNPLRPEAISKNPWTAERRNEEIGNVLDQFPHATIEEARGIASDNEARELAQPIANQARDEELKKIKKEAIDKFTNQLETKLQKKGPEVYSDLTGEMINNLHRGMEKDLRSNPNATVDDVANKWTNKGLDLAKTKTQLAAEANRDMVNKVLGRGNLLDKLKSYGKSFADANNKEEYYNILKSKKSPEVPLAFNMSPSGAAYIAYPRNSNIEKYADKIRPSFITKREENSRKYAKDIEKMMTSDDSFLSVAKAISMKDPYFDQSVFFNQLRDDRDEILMNPRLARELDQGESDYFPDWGDILILPQVFK